MTLTHWNPSTPDRVGLEIPVAIPAGGRGIHQLGPNDAWLQPYRSEANDTVDSCALNLSRPAVPELKGLPTFGVWVVEVFAAGDEVLDPDDWSAWTGYAPNQLTSSSGTWLNVTDNTVDSAGTPDVAYIDETTPDDLGTTINLYGGQAGHINFRFATGTQSLGGKRIRCRVRMQVTSGIGPTKITASLSDGSRLMKFASRTVPSTSTPSTFSIIEFDLPETLHALDLTPWTDADVEDMDVGSHIRFDVAPANVCAISWVRFEVSTIDENRVAYAVFPFDRDVSAETVFAQMGTPADINTAWSKAVNTDYMIGVRRFRTRSNLGGIEYGVDANNIDGALKPTDPALTYLHGPTDPGWSGYSVPTIGATEFDGSISSDDRGVVLPDGAYAQIGFAEFAVGAADDVPAYTRVLAAEVNTDSDVAQEISSPASTTYDGLEVICRYDLLNPPTEDLDVQVLRDSDSTVFGEGTITVDDIRAAPTIGGGWKLVTVELSSVVALVSGTDYSMTFTSSTPATAPYYLQYLDCLDGDSLLSFDDAFNVATFGGTEGITIDASLIDTADLVAWLYDGPDAPSNFAVAADADATDWTSDAVAEITDCPPAEIPFVAITWDDAGLGADHASYRIQRKDEVDPVWRTIATVTDDGQELFEDYEARIGVQSDYRMRAESIYGGGAWTGTESETLSHTNPAMFLSSNQDRSQVFAVIDAYNDFPAEQTYSYEEAFRERAVPISGRDGSVVFRSAERSLVTFERRVLVGARLAAEVIGTSSYEGLTALAKDSALPYVCVRDEIGNRWFSNVRIPEAVPLRTDCDIAALYASMTVTETSIEPTAAVA